MTAGGWRVSACLACSSLIARVGQTVWKDQGENTTAGTGKLWSDLKSAGGTRGALLGDILLEQGKAHRRM